MKTLIENMNPKKISSDSSSLFIPDQTNIENQIQNINGTSEKNCNSWQQNTIMDILDLKQKDETERQRLLQQNQ
jgi:hypothetical protein